MRSGRPLKWAVWLARARLVLGDAGGAEQVAGAALQALEKHNPKLMRTPFVTGEPKTLALTIGAAAALERGRLDKATRFVQACVEINQCVGCTRQFFTKSFLGNEAAVMARSSGEEPASPRHRAGVASMAWRTAR